MRTFVLATILVSQAMVFTAGAACDNVPSTKMEYACRACHSNWYHVCRDALQSAPDAAEVSTYPLIATRKANLKYSDTMNEITMMLGVGILPGEEREAISHCKEKQEYMDALTAIRSCLNRLHGSFRSLPLYGMVAADFALTGVANDLEALINVG
ncbi:hypothetical protein C2845_PM14G02350 [Panicum miliaceum]|uniref:Pectinesterase inhibitor domain-containing protein n=1 Tax=Panicum miliaceum TaxID=4540 RepID=A0A3L6PPP2_PANMI|nr:hypothetical protein C2845_PM14G02350 [Panicum miliaceum]